jgi:hypothetical protein
MTIYWTILHRWVEMRNYALVSATPWPLQQPTLGEAFETFSGYYNATAKRWRGRGLSSVTYPNLSLLPNAQPWSHKCTNPLNTSRHCAQLPLLRAQLFSRCPVALGGGDGEPVVPYAVNASSCYSLDPRFAKPHLNGRWISDGGAPAWLEFTLTSVTGGNSHGSRNSGGGVAVSLLRAVNTSDTGGVYELHFDGRLVQRYTPKVAAPLIW